MTPKYYDKVSVEVTINGKKALVTREFVGKEDHFDNKTKIDYLEEDKSLT